MFLGSFFGLLAVEQSLRLRLHDQKGNFTAAYFTIVCVFASVDTILKLIVQKICKYIIGKILKVTATWYFILFWVCNSYTSYLPVLFRIYLYGNIAGNPDEGYHNLGNLRFKHCLQYGCIDAVIYLLVAISLTYFAVPLVKMTPALLICCKKLKKSGCCSSFWCYCCNKCKESACCSSCCNKSQDSCCGSWCKNKCSNMFSKIKDCFFIYSHFSDKYVEFAVFYGYMIFFVTIAGVIPLLIALVSVPLTTHLIAISYLNTENNRAQDSSNTDHNNKQSEAASIPEGSNTGDSIKVAEHSRLDGSNTGDSIKVTEHSRLEGSNTGDSIKVAEHSRLEGSNTGDSIKVAEHSRLEGSNTGDSIKVAKKEKKNNKKFAEEDLLYNVWRVVLLGMTAFSTFTNVAHVIPNSRFLQHVSYSTKTGYHPTLDLQGYLNIALPKHSLTRLIEIGAFPNYNAHYLPQKYTGGNNKKNSNGKDILYLPFINFACLKKHNYYHKENFTRDEYINYTRKNRYNSPIIKYNEKKQAMQRGLCFKEYQCRSRGILMNTEQGKHLLKVRGISCSVFILPIPFIIIAIVIACIVGRRTEQNQQDRTSTQERTSMQRRENRPPDIV